MGKREAIKKKGKNEKEKNNEELTLVDVRQEIFLCSFYWKLNFKIKKSQLNQTSLTQQEEKDILSPKKKDECRRR